MRSIDLPPNATTTDDIIVMRRHRRLGRRHRPGWLLVVALALPAGCRIGTGGTGERVVPPAQLREIEPLDLSAVAREPTVDELQRATPPATQPTSRPTTLPVTVSLSLAQVRQLALANNADLRVELLNPAIARQSLGEEEARFEATFTTDVRYSRSDNPTASQLVGNQGEDWQLTPGIDIPLRTGGTIRLSTPFSRSETDNQFFFLNPAYQAGPAASMSIPLLRGAGIDVNAQRIRVAFYTLQRTEARTKLEVTRVLADAERAYWRLFAAREELTLRRQEYRLAQLQLDQATRRLQQNLVAEIDRLRAESGAADRFEQILIAERNLRDRQRELKRLINAPGLDVGGIETIEPATAPVLAVFDVDADKLYSAALSRRMELLETELQIAEETANVRAARNDLLPLVTLEYTYGVNGLGPSMDDALSQVRQANFQNHSAGLRLEVPIGNEAARSRLRRAMYSRVQRLATKEQRQLQIRQEIFAATDALQVNFQRIIAARKRVDLARRTYEGEQRQYDLGRRTSTELLDALTRLADARQSEIAAIAEYQIAQVDLAFATGMVLGQSRIAWEPTIDRTVEPRR
jgi:outer membrane protein TolC